MSLALNTFLSSFCSFTPVNEALFLSIFRVFNITIVFSGVKTQLINYFMGWLIYMALKDSKGR